MFNLSFDQASLLEKLKTIKINNPNIKKLDSLQELKTGYYNNLNQLNQKLKNRNYNETIKKAKETFDKSVSDSVYAKKRSLKIRESKRQIDEFELDTKMLDSLRNSLSEIEQKIRILKLMNEYGIDDIKNLNKSRMPKSKKLPFMKPNVNGVEDYENPRLFNLFKSIRKLDLLDFYPNYSTLVLSNTSLRGGQIEVNPKYVYAGIAMGLLNTGNWGLSKMDESNKLLSFRGGIGNLDKNYIGALYLKGTENRNDSTFKISNSINQVIGIQFRYILFDSHIFEGEKAWSNLYYQQVYQSFDEVKNSISTKRFNSAFFLSYRGSIPRIGTKLHALYKEDQPFFYSMGNPFNRKDFSKLEGSLNQRLIKNKLSVTGLLRKEMDNISNIKSSTTIILTRELILEYKKKNSRYRLNSKNIKTHNSSLGNLANINLVSFTYSNLFKIGKYKNSLVFVYGYLNSYLKVANINHFGMVSNTMFVNSKFNVNNQLSYNIKESGTDSLNSYNLSLTINYTPQSKIILSGLISFYRISEMENRYVLGNNISYIFNKNNVFALKYEYQFVKPENSTKSIFNSLNVKWIYSF